MKRTWDIGPYWEDRCLNYGAAVAESYGRGANEASRCVGVPGHDIALNPEEQAEGRRHEVGFCFAFGLDPEVHCNWEMKPDRGSVDITYGPIRVDIKGSSNPRARLMIWPSSKTHFFESTQFNVLVFVRSHQARRHQEIIGWLTKDEFRERKIIAESGNLYDLTTGTWYTKDYWAPEALRDRFNKTSIGLKTHLGRYRDHNERPQGEGVEGL